MSDETAAPKKLTGIQMPLNVSAELAKVIGSKKGEQVGTSLAAYCTSETVEYTVLQKLNTSPQVSRPQVVKKLWAYLKEKNLQVSQEGLGGRGDRYPLT